MKRLQKGGVGVFLSLAVGFILHGPATAGPLQPAWPEDGGAYNSNNLWLAITGITNNAASLAVNIPGTITNGVYDLFFATSLASTQGWSRITRCASGQTNLVVTNLPPAQGFFMVGSSIRPGFDQQILDRNDDNSTGLVPLLFTINFLSYSESALYVNNNGNVTFDKALSAYSPVSLAAAGVKIIAPFWADVDTRNSASDVVKYGTNVVNGHNAFGVDWVNVGYYSTHADKLLSCQLVIIDRSDIGPGNFDMEFNYDRVEWQWGDVSVNYPPRAGFSDGVTDDELPGSGVTDAFLDTNTVTGLIYKRLKSPLPGQYLFFFRNGQPLP